MKLNVLRGNSTGFFLNPWYPYILTGLLAYFAADLIILNIRPTMLPEKAPPARRTQTLTSSMPARSSYGDIIARNIFSLDGTIPNPLVGEGMSPIQQRDEAPVQSQLPLNLVGTIVHSNPEKSVASIEIKSKNAIMAFRTKATVEGLATVEKIQRGYVILRNVNSGRLEFIQTASAAKLSFKSSAPVIETNKTDVQQVGQNQFALNRNDLLKYTNNLASILQQARSVPNRNPNTGEIDGFRILDYQPGSIYEQLGLQRMDIIKGVNGETVDSPAKAMELYNALKNSDKISIVVERNGRSETMEYSIK